jgi:hypothetical protein
MTRSILATLASIIAVTVMLGAGGCQASGVGDPCVPEEEYDPSFTGFDPRVVNVESRSFQCQTRLCLVNHFRGRVTCPYGQGVTQQPPTGVSNCVTNTANGPTAGCCIPGANVAVDGKDPTTGNYINMNMQTGQSSVPPQCLDRTAPDTVYCSCRCANINGDTNDGSNYCTCPSGFDCKQLVSSIGAGNEGLTGAYCVKSGTEYDPSSCNSGYCDSTLMNCGDPHPNL